MTDDERQPHGAQPLPAGKTCEADPLECLGITIEGSVTDTSSGGSTRDDAEDRGSGGG